MNKNRKGFTIVELVIVIAIIAILAAVLIPTFASLIQKANISKDTQVIRNLNTAIATATEKPETMRDALKIAAEAGYLVDKINAAANGNDILWDSENKVFCYYNAATKAVAYIPETKIETTNAPEYKFWKIYNDKMPALSEQRYSIYLTANATADEEVTVKVGFDAGDNTKVKTVNYKNEGNEGAGQKVDIFTNGGNLIVNAKNDTVSHFGEADKVNVVSVAGHSYYENGKVTVSLEVKAGHVVVASSAVVKEVIVPTDAAADTKVEIKENSTVSTIVVDSKTATVEVKENANVEQVIAANDSTNITLPSTIASNKVAKTVVSTKDALIAAIKDASVKYIELGANIDVVTAITIDRDLTIDGTANKYSITASSEDKTEGRTINIGRNDNAAIKVTLKNLKVVGPAVSGNRGLNIWQENVSLDLVDSEVTCAYYAINITGSANKTKLNVFNSKLSGWAALNIWAAYNEINVVNSELIGTNNKPEGGSNNFATICFEADTTFKTEDHTFNSTVVIRSSVVKAVETNKNQQHIVTFNTHIDNNGKSWSATGNRIEFFDCTLDYSNGNDFEFNNAPNQVFVNGQEKTAK